MKKFLAASAAMMLALSLGAKGHVCSHQADYSSYYKNSPIELTPVSAPVIPDYSVSLKDFGGVDDGVTSNTEAFAKAIAHLAQKGGGHLIVPAGMWLTGPITLEDNIDLHAEQGAFVLFSANLNDYPLVDSSFEGLMVKRCQAPISAVGKKNIAITGEGIFNGNGQNWRALKRSKTTDGQWKKVTESGGVVGNNGNTWYPNERIAYGNMNPDKITAEYIADPDSLNAILHDFSRPNMVVLRDCENVLLKGVTFENSPAWNVHPLLCRNMIIDGINIRNPWYAQNGDGLDLESCTDVLLVNSTLDVGDDAICLKSGKDKPGRDRGVPTSRVLVDGCVVYHGHGGFVVGSEMTGGVKDVVCRNCSFDGTDVGLRFKSGRGRGGVVENIYIDGINMYNIGGNALVFNMYYGGKAPLDEKGNVILKDSEPAPVADEGTPLFRNITMSHVYCNGADKAAEFRGLPEMYIKDITLTDCAFATDRGFYLNYVDGLKLNNVKIIPASGAPITEGSFVTSLQVK